MKHSPGPWTIAESSPRSNQDNISIRDADGTSICRCWKNKLETEQVQANAQLVAASPELLDALKMGVLFVDSIMSQLGRVACDIGLLNEFLCSARPAIHKAEGEKS